MGMRQRSAVAVAMLVVLCGHGARLAAQASETPSSPTESAPDYALVDMSRVTQNKTGNSLPAGAGVLVDQVIAVVNGDLILESDVDEDRRFQAFQPYTNPNAVFSREAAIKRLIDRTLILQQAKLQPDSMVTDAEAQAQLQSLRKEIRACKEDHCETAAGWAKFVSDHGFTMDELTERWKQRMQVLKFIEIRFRSGIEITPAQIKDYYDKTLLPEYAKRDATAPKLAVISDRIQEILLQEQVSSLLADWLKSLKAQGTVRVMAPSEGL
jgi:peptidyl-prolyl cis-trans isomerase SurA